MRPGRRTYIELDSYSPVSIIVLRARSRYGGWMSPGKIARASFVAALFASGQAWGQATPSIPTESAAPAAPQNATPSPSGQSTGNAAPTPTPAQMEEARQRYRRALELYDEGTKESSEAALLELERAYALAPSFRLLYNVGLVSTQLRQYARAYDAFERYLKEGGSDVPSGRREEVRADMARLALRTGLLRIKVDVAGAEVAVDDAVVGTTPIETPVRVNAGRRRVSITASGRPPQQRIVEVAGGDSLALSFELESAAVVGQQPYTAAVETPKRSVPWLLWGATGVATVGAIVGGVLALKSGSDFEAAQRQEGIDARTLSSKHSTLTTTSIVTDVLAVTALGLAAVSLYVTLKAPSKPSQPSVGALVSPNGAMLQVRAF